MEWIFRAQQFLDYYDTPHMDCVTIASIHMDKEVICWFQMIQRTTPFASQDSLTRTLKIEFGPSIFDCPQASLFKLQQRDFDFEYYLEFMALANQVQKILLQKIQ